MNERFSKKIEEVSGSFAEKVDTLQKKYLTLLESVSSRNDGIISKVEQRFTEDNKKITEKYDSQILQLQTQNQQNYDEITKKFQKQDDFS